MARWRERVHHVEDGVVALLMAAMTIVTFSQVIARYFFNTGWSGALEFTRVLFAWLILFGMAYGIRVGAHLGIDVFIRALPRRLFRIMAMVGAACGVLYAIILLWAGWLQWFGLETRGGAADYWWRMYRIGIGMEELRYPEWFSAALGTQDRVHRWVAYLILPVGLALLALRCGQALLAIRRGERETVVAAHEDESLLEEVRSSEATDGPAARTAG